MMQIQADTLGIPVLRPSMTETTSLGAAIVGKMLNNKLLIKVCIVLVELIHVISEKQIIILQLEWPRVSMHGKQTVELI